MATATQTQTQSQAAPRSSRDQGLVLLGVLAAAMWAVEIADAIAFDLDRHGIAPRDTDGLDGILWAPFLHDGFGHLTGNTLPFLVLGAGIAVAARARVAAVTVIVVVVGGLVTWLAGPEHTIHVGASGVVFGYAGYLVARGIFSRRLVHLAVGVAVLAVYGTTLLLGLVPEAGISWQGHLFGAVGGLVAARVLDARGARPAATSYSRA